MKKKKKEKEKHQQQTTSTYKFTQNGKPSHIYTIQNENDVAQNEVADEAKKGSHG